MLELHHLAISPSGFVFDPRSGATYSLNPSGVALLEGLRDGLGLGALTEQLQQSFSVRSSDLGRDVLDFVRVLQNEGLVPRSYQLGA